MISYLCILLCLLGDTANGPKVLAQEWERLETHTDLEVCMYTSFNLTILLYVTLCAFDYED